jgi:multiple sugar transport system permease protein
MHEMSTNSRRLKQPLVYLFLSILALLYIAPFFWMISTSLKPQREIFDWPPSLLPKEPTLENYARVPEVIPMFRAYWNTFYTTAILVATNIIAGSLAGYVFEKLRFPLKEVIFSAVLLTLIIPFQSEMVPLYLLMTNLNLIDTHAGVVLPQLMTAFAIFFFRQNMKSIPDDLLDSAKIDGCSVIGRYWRIIMPLIKPAIGTIAIFTFMQAWSNFLWPLIVINSVDKMLLEQVLSYFSQGLETNEEGARMAGATMAVFPILMVFLFAQRYFVRGIALTGLK